MSSPAAVVALLLFAASAAAAPSAARGDSFGTMGATIGSLLQLVAAGSPSLDGGSRGQHREAPCEAISNRPCLRAGERGFGGGAHAARLRRLANTPPPAA